MDAEKVEKVCKRLEDSIEIAYRNADLDLPSNQMHVVYPIRVDTCDAKTILSAIRELKAENDRLKQGNFIDAVKLREKLGCAESCEKCKKDSWRCQRDAYFTEMDFCERLDIAIEELIQEGR